MPDRVTACTIVAQNYLPAARVLADTYLAHHPDHRFVIGVIDAESHELASNGPGFDILGYDACGVDTEEFLCMATAYTVMELATAVKPYLLRELRRDNDVVIYLDPDIQVYAPLDGIVERATERSIVLTPHNLAPIPRDGKEPDEAVIMGTGIFNLGFIAVGPNSGEFLDFWAQRLRQDAIDAPRDQLFTDQRWVDFVPALFEHYVARDPGLNVAYWNAWERPLQAEPDGTITAGGTPLRFVHFSGYRPDKPWLLSGHCARDPRVLLSEYPMLRQLCDGYADALAARGYHEKAPAYRFNTMSCGETITPAMRRTFRDAWVAAERTPRGYRSIPAPPHAFGPDGGKEFLQWLATPQQPDHAAAGINRVLLQVWHRRADLQQAFPHPTGADAEAFRSWCRSSGVTEREVPAWALPEEPPHSLPPDDRLGVNLVGYLTAELGLGEMGRVVHHAIQQAGVPVVSVVEDRSVSNRTNLPAPDSAGDPGFPLTLLAVNADQTKLIRESHPHAFHQRYVIGLWAWELEDFPSWLHDAFELVDEVWTISDFCRRAIAAHSPVPVHTIPVPVREHPLAEKAPDGTARFLFAFDFNSVGERKNPWGVVEAFRTAFDERDDVRLTVKTINEQLHPHAAERLRSSLASDPRIELVEGYLSVGELAELYERSDCYVSLHRSEGFGLTVAEAMARGLPTITTGYSGTTEFTTPETGWTVRHSLVNVGEGCFPYHPEARWAEPDLAEAAQLMRLVADDPAEARRKGIAAREHLRRTRSLAMAAEWMRERLSQAYARWQDKPVPTTTQAPTGSPATTQGAARSSAGLAQAREALRWRPDAAAPSRLPLAPALRKAVLRAIDHYDVHQRHVLGTLLDGVEDGIAELHGRADDVSAQAATSASLIAQLERRLSESLEREESLRQELWTAVAAVRQERADITAEITAGISEHVEAAKQEMVAKLADESGRTHAALLDRDQRADRVDVELSKTRSDLHAAVGVLEGDSDDTVLCDAGVLRFPPGDEVVARWVRHHRSWEPDEAELLATLMAERDGRFVDIGAHVGYHTIRLLRRQPTRRAVAVEAQPDTAELLRHNVRRNLDDPDAVTVVAAAAWDEPGEVGLEQVDPANSGDYRVAGDGQVTVTVPALRLTDVPEVTDVAVIKVDLQGRDHRALAGMREVLRADRPDVVCEFSPAGILELGDDPARVLAAYRELGYRHCWLSGEQAPAEELIAAATQGSHDFVTVWLRPIDRMSREL